MSYLLLFSERKSLVCRNYQFISLNSIWIPQDSSLEFICIFLKPLPNWGLSRFVTLYLFVPLTSIGGYSQKLWGLRHCHQDKMCQWFADLFSHPNLKRECRLRAGEQELDPSVAALSSINVRKLWERWGDRGAVVTAEGSWYSKNSLELWPASFLKVKQTYANSNNKCSHLA